MPPYNMLLARKGSTWHFIKAIEPVLNPAFFTPKVCEIKFTEKPVVKFNGLYKQLIALGTDDQGKKAPSG